MAANEMMGKRNAMENKQSEKNHQHTRAKHNTLQINVENRKRKEPKKKYKQRQTKNTSNTSQTKELADGRTNLLAKGLKFIHP